MHLVARLISLIAFVVSAVVILGAVLFAVELASEPSERRRARLAPSLEPVPTPVDERDRERRHNDFREAVDDANDVLLAPFSALLGFDGIWARRTVALVLALLLYGLALSLLAGFVRRG